MGERPMEDGLRIWWIEGERLMEDVLRVWWIKARAPARSTLRRDRRIPLWLLSLPTVCSFARFLVVWSRRTCGLGRNHFKHLNMSFGWFPVHICSYMIFDACGIIFSFSDSDFAKIKTSEICATFALNHDAICRKFVNFSENRNHWDLQKCCQFFILIFGH